MTKAALYLRVSLDSTGEELAVQRQRKKCLEIAASRGWVVVGEYVDNSISASDERKQRPAYDELCRDYEAGSFEAIVCWDMDRLTRQPRQLEDWIKASDKRGLQIVTANGDADLRTDDGILFAGIKLQVARAEVRRKAARQAAAQLQRAEMGKPAKGVRLTGYTVAGEQIEAEVAIVRRIFNQFTAGGSLKGIAAALDRDGITTRRGGRWSSSSVSSILSNARYSGRSIYKGRDVGAAIWPAIVSEAQFSAAQARLDDPRRKTRGESTARKHPGSGLYFCTCGLRVKSSSGMGNGLHRYTCRAACFYRSGTPVDHYVLTIIRGRLALPDLRELLARPADKSRLAALAAERTELRHRLKATQADYDNDLIDGLRYKAKTAKLHAQLDVVRAEETRLVAQTGPTILGADNPVSAFDDADLAIQQQVVDSLATVTLRPGKRGSKAFDPDSVTIAWK